MQKRGLSQESLKLLACMTMLVDHLAVIIVMGSLFYPSWYAAGNL